jgi:signal transduction histidine kinase
MEQEVETDRSRLGTVEYLEERLAALSSEESSERVDVLNALAWEVGFSDVFRAESLAREAMRMARAIDYPQGMAWGLLNSTYGDYFKGDYETALEKGGEALASFESLSDRKGVGATRVGLGLVYWSLGDFEHAVENLHEGIEIFRELSIGEEEGWGLTSLGGVFENIGDLEKAIECHTRALALFRQGGHRLGEARALTGLGVVLQRQGFHAKALEHHFASLAIAEEENAHPTAVSRALNDIGTTYQAQGDPVLAEAYLRRALDIRRDSGNRPAEITSLLDLGKLYTTTGDLSRAVEYLESALELASRAKTKPKIYKAHQALADAHEASGDYRRALEHHRRFEKLKEEVLGEETTTRLKNLSIQLESETLTQLKQAQAKLIQAARMASLGRLAAGITHEINTPIGVIQASADLAERALARLEEGLEEEIARQPGFGELIQTLRLHRTTVSRAARRLSDIVSNLKRLTNLDQAELGFADLNEGLDSILRILEPQWAGRLRVVRNFGSIPEIQAYHADLNQAFMTLLINAAEAIEEEGTITVTTSSADSRVRVTTADDGRGIPDELQSSIFDVGFTRRGARIGLHVGLAHVKATVDRHGGEIEFSSQVDRGTTFSISLPVRQR